MAKQKTEPKKGYYERSGLLQERVEEVEYEMIVESLDKHEGNISLATEELGCSRAGLYAKMERLGIDINDWRD